MKIHGFTLGLLIFASSCHAQTFDWVVSSGSSLRDKGFGIDVDAVGNSYVTGYFQGTMVMGTYTLTAIGGEDVFVAKYNSAGNVLWAFSEGGTGNEQGLALACDSSGNFAITGVYTGAPTFGTTTLSANSGYFVAYYNSSGVFQWAEEFGSPGGGIAADVDLDPLGRPVIVGYFTGTENFGTTTLTSTGQNEGFVLRYDATGNFDWAVSFGGTLDDYANGVNTDLNGNVFVTGRYNGTAIFGSLPTTTAGGFDVFLTKLDPSGNFLWVAGAGNCPGDDSGEGVDVDAQGNVFITGYIALGTALFGSSTYLNSSGMEDGFVACYSNSGTFQWAKSFGGTGDDFGADINVSIPGAIFISGFFTNTATIGTTNLTSSGGKDVLVVMIDTWGNFHWALGGGGTGNEIGRSISTGGGYIYFAGLTDSTGTYSASAVPNNGVDDVIVGKILAENVGVAADDETSLIRVYPNPASDQLHIQPIAAFEENVVITIYDVTGKSVLVQQCTSTGQSIIDVSALGTGIYTLIITGEEINFTSKFIRE